MFSRRTFLTSATAATALPQLIHANSPSDYDPTPQQVRIKKDFQPGQLLILPRSFYLYFVTEPRKALRYGCGVGKAGLEFTGTAVIQVKKEWPTWRPTQEMIVRSPKTYARFANNSYVEPGGPENPLGARALYLYEDGRDTLYRIHGTNEPWSIGKAVSSGCIRLFNQDIVDLYSRVNVGAEVVVL